MVKEMYRERERERVGKEGVNWLSMPSHNHVLQLQQYCFEKERLQIKEEEGGHKDSRSEAV